ncbi:hypothetical protein M422DRAFT_257030, partial [Sphaerobolus stellatus SS14]
MIFTDSDPISKSRQGSSSSSANTSTVSDVDSSLTYEPPPQALTSTSSSGITHMPITTPFITPKNTQRASHRFFKASVIALGIWAVLMTMAQGVVGLAYQRGGTTIGTLPGPKESDGNIIACFPHSA